MKVTIRAAHGSSREEAVRHELAELLRKYDVSRWTFTGKVIVEQGVIPHSHPVLTLTAIPIRPGGTKAALRTWSRPGCTCCCAPWRSMRLAP